MSAKFELSILCKNQLEEQTKRAKIDCFTKNISSFSFSAIVLQFFKVIFKDFKELENFFFNFVPKKLKKKNRKQKK